MSDPPPPHKPATFMDIETKQNISNMVAKPPSVYSLQHVSTTGIQVTNAPSKDQLTGQATAQATAAVVVVPLWKKEMWGILDKLRLRKECEIFLEPVPWKELELLDYLDIIGNRPMDVGTLTKNLAEGKYKNVNDCTDDMRLIWTNALVYNAQGSAIYKQAKNLSDMWEGLWAVSETGRADPMRPPSTDEQIRFADNCHQLSNKDLGRVLMLLDDLRPQCLMKDPISRSVEINLDVLNGIAYRKASALIKEILGSKNTSKTQASKK